MPIMNSFEQKQILAHSDFFYDKGYRLIEKDTQGVTFTNGKIQYIIFYERRQEASDITIKFIQENECFSVGWLSRMMDKNIDIQQKLENILYLLDFIEKNHYIIIDISFCRKVMQELEMQFRSMYPDYISKRPY